MEKLPKNNDKILQINEGIPGFINVVSVKCSEQRHPR